MAFINSIEDMKWLHEVHGIHAESAVISGNEDAPTCVHAYDDQYPDYDTNHVRIFMPNDDGILVITDNIPSKG
jgi:hypothetical protein